MIHNKHIPCFCVVLVLLVLLMQISYAATSDWTTIDGGDEYNYRYRNVRTIVIPKSDDRVLTYDGFQHQIPDVKVTWLADTLTRYYKDEKRNSYLTQKTYKDVTNQRIYFEVDEKSTGSILLEGWYAFRILPANLNISVTSMDIIEYDDSLHELFACDVRGVCDEIIPYSSDFVVTYIGLDASSQQFEGRGVPSAFDQGLYSIKYTVSPLDDPNYCATTKDINVLILSSDHELITIPDNCSTIDSLAFRGIPFVNIFIGENVINIAESAFADCSIVVIHGAANSFAHSYAMRHNYFFIEE